MPKDFNDTTERQVIDATGPTDWNRRKELCALRRRIRGWSDNLAKGRYSPKVAGDYARAMGVSPWAAENLIMTHTEHLESMPRYVQKGDLVDATGPTSWNKTKESRALRRRILAMIDSQVRTGTERSYL